MPTMIALEPSSNKPLYIQVAEAICTAIESGVLKPGRSLPSSRELAEDMAVSRETVRKSYELLASQGHIKAFSRGKTIVTKKVLLNFNPAKVTNETTPTFSKFGQFMLGTDSAFLQSSADLDRSTNSACNDIPFGLWQRALRKAVTKTRNLGASYESDPFGSLELREALRNLLLRTRGIECSTEQIVVYSSSQGGFDLTCRILLNSGDTVAVEDPGFKELGATCSSNGINMLPVPVDMHGMQVQWLDDTESEVRLAYVTPAGQNPTGVTMSRDRRRQLINWASRKNAFIVEDDFDWEFRYGESPQLALKSIDDRGVVIYSYSFWKSLYPLVKISFSVLPNSLVPVFQKAQLQLTRDVPLIEQSALANFIHCGYLERHLARKHKAFKVRRAALIHGLSVGFSKSISISHSTAGTNIIVQFGPQFTKETLDWAARKSGLAITSTASYYRQAIYPSNEFLIDFANLTEDEIAVRTEQFGTLCKAQLNDVESGLALALPTPMISNLIS